MVGEKVTRKVILFDIGKGLCNALSRLLSRFDIEVIHNDDFNENVSFLRKNPQTCLALMTEQIKKVDVLSVAAVVKRVAPTMPVILIMNKESKLLSSDVKRISFAEILTQPLNFPQLLLKVKDYSLNKTVSASVAPVEKKMIAVDYPAQLTHLVKNISLNGLGLRATMPMAVGSLLQLEIPALYKKLSLPAETRIFIRVVNCRTSNHDNRFYTIGSEFIALPRKVADKITAACTTAIGLR